MKTLLVTIAILICSILSLAQTSRFFTPGKSTYTSQFVPTPLDADAIMKAGAKRQATYDHNKEAADDLLNWIIDLLKESDDNIFNNSMDYYVDKLQSYFDKDYSILGNELRKIEFKVKQEIVEHNDRVKSGEQAPKATMTKYDKLEKLQSLLDKGTITQEEFESEKKKVLASD